jgi:hypothetical protein
MTETSSGTRRYAFTALLAVGLVIAAGCSKSDTPVTTASGSASGSTGTTTSGSSTTSSSPGTTAPSSTTSAPASTTSAQTNGTAAPSADDQQAAEASLITASDVPAGFTKSTATASDSPNPFLGVPECAPYQKAIKASDDQRTGRAKAAFKTKAGDNLEDEVDVYTDDQIAKDAADVLVDPGFPSCVEAAFKASLKSTVSDGSTIDSVKATRADLASASDLGVDSATAFTVDITYTVRGQTATLKTGVAMLTSGRALSQLSSESPSAVDLGPTVRAAAAKLKANAPS